MGLAEKRALQAYQTEIFPKTKSDINSAAGFDIPFDVKWDTLAVDGRADSYPEYFGKVYFEPLIAALKSITADQMGKDALKAALKTVVITNEGGFYSPAYAITFEAGALKIDHQPDANVDDINDRTVYIRELLEKAL